SCPSQKQLSVLGQYSIGRVGQNSIGANSLQLTLNGPNPFLSIFSVGECARLLREAFAPNLGTPLVLTTLCNLSHTPSMAQDWPK
ncbi:MAG: hypothetical protein KGL57_07995, partial [Burkholderiales bacterium]|nr:hypothetical protein [Burkholderiales bacterium]